VGDLLPILQNDLESAALTRHPQIERMKEELIAGGAKGALMSGSGPVIFGLFASKKEAQETEKAIALPAGWKTILTRGI